MARLARKTQKVFGGNSSANGQFGSAREGTNLLSNDPDIIQGLPAWESGLNAATISGEKLPVLEEAQGVHYVTTRQIAYVLQEGIPEYDADTVYYEDSIVKAPGTVTLYRSLTDDNSGNPVSDTENWEYLTDLSSVQPFDNFTATVAPTVSDDANDGYKTGSIWYNTATSIAYMCMNNSVGAAVWRRLSDFDQSTLGTAAYQAASSFAPSSIISAMAGRVLSGIYLSNGVSGDRINVSSGAMVSDDGTTIMTLGATLNKTVLAWSAGNGNGGLDTGTIGDGVYFIYVIHNPTTVTTDVLISLSQTSPVLPAGYTKKALVAPLIRGSGGFLKFIQQDNTIMLGQIRQVLSLTSGATTEKIISTGLGARTLHISWYTSSISNSRLSLHAYEAGLTLTPTDIVTGFQTGSTRSETGTANQFAGGTAVVNTSILGEFKVLATISSIILDIGIRGYQVQR